MKTEIQIRTGDFEYINRQFDEELSEEDAVEKFNMLKRAWGGGPGLETKVFNDSLVEYLQTGKLRNGTELYSQMDIDQQRTFQDIKKAFKRITNTKDQVDLDLVEHNKQKEDLINNS